MSLLMDALKRAEKARQAEAERAKAEGRASEAPELSLDPMEDTSAPVEDRPPPDPDAPRRQREPGADTEDSLELTPVDVRREIESMDDALLEDVTERADDELPESKLEDSLSLDYGDIPIDETGATLPSVRSAQRSVQDYFDGTHSMSLSMEDMRDAIDTEDAAPEAGADTLDGDTTSRRRAQTVLDARAIAPSNTGRNVALVLLALIVIGLGSAGLMFKDRILALIDGQPTVVARRAPPPVPVPSPAQATPASTPSAAPPTVVAAPPPAATIPVDDRDALLRAAEAARAEERALGEAAAAARASMQAQAQAAVSTAPPAPSASVSPEPASAPVPAQTAASPSLPQVPLAAVLRESPTPGARALPPAAGLKITRRRAPGRTHGELVSAFDAFQRGDDGEAMSTYQKVLSREPRNRDAMLGVAAVYMRAQAYEQAAGYYVEVLQRNPRDPVAQAALISLQENLDPVSGETRLKRLLASNPADANLHFGLGNLYAEQGRWPEAQQAYFEAYRLQSENPDHAFNLAVSLDRLSQHKAAHDYYERALTLAADRPAAFSPDQARARVAALAVR